MALAGALEIQMSMGIARITSDVAQVKSIVGGGMKSVESAVSQAKSVLASLGVGVGLGAIVAMTKGVIDAADNFNDLTQAVGINRQELAAYQLATAQSGTSLEGLGRGIKGLSNAFAEHGDALEKAGINAQTQDGRMRQLADVFSKMPDGIEKTTLATKLFGKSGMELIPMLNMGSAGLEQAAQKSAAYAAVMATLAPQADQFNDTMAELAMVSKIAGMSMINNALPALTGVAAAMAEAAHEGGILKAIWVGLGGIAWESVFKPLTGLIKGTIASLEEANAAMLRFFGANDAAAYASQRAARIWKEVAELQTESAAPIKKAETDTAAWTEQLKKLYDALGLGKKAVNEFAKEIEKLLALGRKGEEEAGVARVKTWEDEQKAINDLRNAGLEEDGKLLALGVAGAEAAAVARAEAAQEEIKAINEGRNALFDEETARIKKLADEQKQADEKRQREWGSTWSEVERTGKGVFIALANGGEDMAHRVGAAIKSSIIDLLYQMTLKKWIIEIGASVAGSMGISTAASAAGTASSGMSLVSGASSLSSLFSSGSMFSSGAAFGQGFLQTAFLSEAASAAMIEAGTVGYAGLGMEAGAASGLGAIPVYGWIALAVVAAYAYFASRGETVQGSGAAQMGLTGNITGYTGELHGGYGNAPALIATSAAALTKFGEIVTSLGGKISDLFTIGIGQGGGGEFNVATGIGASNIRDVGGLSPEAMQLEVARAIVVGLQQAADFPAYLKAVFAAIDAGTASAEQINNALAFAGTLKQIHDNLTETRPAFQILLDESAKLQAELGATASGFKEFFLTAVESGNMTPEALAKWQKLAGYIDAVNEAIAKAGADQAALVDHFSTPAQKIEAAWTAINTQAEKIGYSGPITAEVIRKFADGLDKTTPAGQAMIEMLTALVPAFDAVFNSGSTLSDAQAGQFNMMKRFGTEADLYAAAQRIINDAAAKFGVVAPTTAKQFYDLVASIDATTPSGQALIKELLGYADAMDIVVQHTADAAEAQKQVLSDVKDLWERMASDSQKLAVASEIATGYLQDTGQSYMPSREEIAERLKALYLSPEFRASSLEDQQKFVDSMKAVADAFDLVTRQAEQNKQSIKSLYSQFASDAQKMADAKATVEQYLKDTGQSYLPSREEIADRLKALLASPEFLASNIVDQTKFIQAMEEVADAFDLVTRSAQISSDWLNKNALDPNLSPLTAQQKLVEAQAQYDAAKAAGDISRMTGAADILLAADKAVEGFGGGYSALFAQIRADIAGYGPGVSQTQIVEAPAVVSNIIDMKTAIARLQEKNNELLAEMKVELVAAINESGSRQSNATRDSAVMAKRA